MTEILAPAGDEKSAYAAIDAGADAIYLGLTSFSARSSAANFDFEGLQKLILHAHFFGVKVYVAMNTLVKDSELEQFVQTAVKVHNLGADALIIQDIYLGAYLKKNYPQMCLHLSTQAGTCNQYSAQYAKDLGFSRVILARETALADIEKIAKIIQTEAFVQGALCTCFSGQCYLSSFAGGNSGNRGKCKQPCRKKYSIDRNGFQQSAYRISLSDLSVGEDIHSYINAGVVSFKIEGRMRRPEYVSAAVKYYRSILKGDVSADDLSALKRTYNRGNYTKGLAFGQDKCFISSAVQGHMGEYVGTVSVISGRYFCRTQNNCSAGDCFKILRDGTEVCGAVYEGQANGGFYIRSSSRLKNGDKVFITTDVRLNERLLSDKRIYKITVSAAIYAGQKPKISINGTDYTAQFICDKASGRPFTEGEFVSCFNKVAQYPFEVSYGEIKTDGQAFVPASQLNAFRREVYQSFYANLAQNPNKPVEEILPLPAHVAGQTNKKAAIISCNLKNLKCDVGILKPNNYSTDLSPLIQGFGGEKFLYIPPYISGDELQKLMPKIAAFDGIYCNAYFAVPLAKELNKKLFAGTGFNIFNRVALSMCGADYVALSKELTISEARSLARENTFYLTSGDIQVMDLIYCPFGTSCKQCDERDCYTLTDEDGRNFVLRRYRLGEYCRFEVFNCAPLFVKNNFTGVLEEHTANLSNTSTKGHSEKPVL